MKILLTILLFISFSAQGQFYLLNQNKVGGTTPPPTATFKPSDIASIGLWYRADTLVTLVSGGVQSWGSITQPAPAWTAPSAGERPTVNPTALNGKAGIQMGYGKQLTWPDVITFSTVYFVASHEGTVKSIFTNSTNGGQYIALRPGQFDIDGNVIHYRTFNAGQFYTLHLKQINGSDRVVGANGDYTSVNNAPGTIVFNTIGKYPGADAWYDGTIVEIFTFSEQLTDEQHANVLNYLKNRYNHY